jgi:hypothetical protein
MLIQPATMLPPAPPPGPAELDSAMVLGPLVPLFAPYCGGVSQQLLLEAAVGQLLTGQWTGERRLDDDGSRRFILAWHGEPAPLETLRCELDFPDFPEIHYEFALPAYRLVLWLMQRQDRQLPVSFWRWLLLGELPTSAGGDPQAVQGDSIA